MKKVLLLFLFIFSLPTFASGIAADSVSAPCTNNTLETYSGNSNLQADWQPNVINLTWYNENEKLTVQSAAQSCVYDGALTIPSTQPTRTGYTFAGWKVRLPGTYTELEYAQGSGSQWIDTNLLLNNNTRIKTKLQVYRNEPGKRSGFSSSLANRANSGFECFLYNGDEMYLYYGNGGITVAMTENDVIEMDWNKNVINYKVNNGNTNQYTFTEQTFTTGYQLRLFALSRGENAISQAYTKIYYFQIYDNNTLIRDFIPARRNSDGVVGMYDTVEQRFYTNPGSTNFIAGPVVQ